MDMLGKVRRMKMRDKLTISEISKRTGLSRNTVKRWLRAPGDVSPKYLRRSDPTKLSAYEATLVMAHGGQEQEQKDQHQHPYCHPRVLDKQVPQIIHPTPLLEHQGHAKA